MVMTKYTQLPEYQILRTKHNNKILAYCCHRWDLRRQAAGRVCTFQWRPVSKRGNSAAPRSVAYSLPATLLAGKSLLLLHLRTTTGQLSLQLSAGWKMNSSLQATYKVKA